MNCQSFYICAGFVFADLTFLDIFIGNVLNTRIIIIRYDENYAHIRGASKYFFFKSECDHYK